MPDPFNLTAAQLSQAAYPGGSVPAGWTAVETDSSTSGANSLTVFVNDDTQQVVIAFKGTDTLSQVQSDLSNAGASAWQDIQPAFESALNNLQSNPDYAGYNIVTDGHSLGGGMAQTAALEYGLSGYGQNSLPIANGTIQDDLGGAQGFASNQQAWLAAGNTFSEVNVSGDPATLTYQVASGDTYLSTQTLTLSSNYLTAEQAGGDLAVEGAANIADGGAGLFVAGLAIAGTAAYEAHSISTVVNDLQQSVPTFSFAPSTVDAACSATLQNLESTTTYSLNADSSVTMTTATGAQYTVSTTQPNDGAALCAQVNGSTGTSDTVAVLAGPGNQTIDASQVSAANDASSVVDLANSDVLNISSGSANVVASGNSDWIFGASANSSAALEGGSGFIDMTGANDSAVVTGGNNLVETSGSNDSAVVTGDSNYADAVGSNESVLVTGEDDNTYLEASTDSAVVTGDYDDAVLQTSDDSALVSGNNDTAVLETSDDSAVVTGNDDTAYSADSSDYVSMSGQSDTSYWDGDYGGGGGGGDYDGGWGGGGGGGGYGGDDPVVFNLKGSKVQTVSLKNSSAYFDMQNNGQSEHTSWITAGEGVLVYDPSDAGVVTDNADLVSGFGALQKLAQSVDGISTAVLSSNDALWQDLKVWVDPTGSGTFQSGDLYSLDQLGISSINLNAVSSTVNSQGIASDSTFTWNNGDTGDVAGVNFTFTPSGVSVGDQIARSNMQLSNLIAGMASLPAAGSIQSQAWESFNPQHIVNLSVNHL